MSQAAGTGGVGGVSVSATVQGMQAYMRSSNFVIFFLGIVVLVDLLFGDKAATVLLILILLNMILVNLSKFETLIGSVSRG